MKFKASLEECWDTKHAVATCPTNTLKAVFHFHTCELFVTMQVQEFGR